MMHFEDITFVEAIGKYGKEWDNLVIKCQINPTLFSGWLKCIYSAYNKLDEVRVFVAHDNDTVYGIIPYFQSKKKFWRLNICAIELAGNIVSYHQELIISENHSEILKHFIEHINKAYQYDLIEVHQISVDSKTINILSDFAKEKGQVVNIIEGESSPYLVFESDWDTLLSKKISKFRYKVRRRNKEYSENPDWVIRWFCEKNEDASTYLEDMLKIEGKSWKVASGKDINSRIEERKYYELLLPYLSNTGLLFANILYIKDEPVAYVLCYKINGFVGHIKTSYDKDYKDFSVGALVIEDTLRKCIDERLVEFDFLGDIMQHKMYWTSTVRKHVSLMIYNGRLLTSMIGRLKSFKRKLVK